MWGERCWWENQLLLLQWPFWMLLWIFIQLFLTRKHAVHIAMVPTLWSPHSWMYLTGLFRLWGSHPQAKEITTVPRQRRLVSELGVGGGCCCLSWFSCIWHRVWHVGDWKDSTSFPAFNFEMGPMHVFSIHLVSGGLRNNTLHLWSFFCTVFLLALFLWLDSFFFFFNGTIHKVFQYSTLKVKFYHSRNTVYPLGLQYCNSDFFPKFY